MGHTVKWIGLAVSVLPQQANVTITKIRATELLELTKEALGKYVVTLKWFGSFARTSKKYPSVLLLAAVPVLVGSDL